MYVCADFMVHANSWNDDNDEQRHGIDIAPLEAVLSRGAQSKSRRCESSNDLESFHQLIDS
jgi:hypothetical protein